MRHIELLQQNNDIQNAIWTAVFTSIIGVLILAVQKFIEHIYLTPINSQKETVEKIAVDLIKYAKFYANPMATNTLASDSFLRRDIEIASDATRELSALLNVKTTNINEYGIWYKLGLIKIEKEKAINAAGKLMALSNSYTRTDRGPENSDLANEIRELLSIPRV